ncbi:MAG: bifunctional 3,4-dihydroxy-2-butanone-4-phosphate synthase/GTP cyclohydrolase II, partial [Phycicoccus sp.]
AYELQDTGLDTVDAQLALGLPVDARDYAAAGGILADLGVSRCRLLTNNPNKVAGLRAHGIEVVAVERLGVPPSPENARYLRTKRERLSHDLVLDPGDTGPTA